jgi:hypothetical protein
LPLAAPRPLQTRLNLRHFGRAPHQARGRRQRGARRGPHGGDKAVPPPMHRRDVARLPRIIAQGLAQLANTHRQHPLTHRRLGPHGVEECVFGHQLPRLADQTPQHGEGLGRKVDHLGVAPQVFAGPVKPIRPKPQGLLGGHCASLLGRGTGVRKTSEKHKSFLGTLRWHTTYCLTMTAWPVQAWPPRGDV